MKTINLGSQGMEVSQLGYGCMGLTSFYGNKLPDNDIVAMLEKTVDQGVTMWDTANIYVYPDRWRLLRFQSPVVCQEEIICEGIKKVGRDKIQICTKTGVQIKHFPKRKLVNNGDPAFIRQQCEDSLRRLQVETIDLFYLHRISQEIPIEITMLEMKKLVEEGKVKYVGLSECSASTIRRAHKIHPLTAVQVEYSLWCRGIEEEVIPTCAELGIGIVAYAPLGRGFFGGLTKSGDKKFARNDYRAHQERLIGEAGKKNVELLKRVQEIADAKECSTAQLALAWVQAQQFRLNGAGVVPIPGTTKEKHLLSNVGSADIELSAEDISALEAAVPREQVEGARYGKGHVGFDTEKNPLPTAEQVEKYGLEL